MNRDLPLSLPEEILLLALHDEKGTLGLESLYSCAVGGAVLAELSMADRIRIVPERKRKLVEVVDRKPLGRPFLDDCLRRIDSDSKVRTIESWVGRFAQTRGLHHRLAGQLCDRGILKADEDRVLLLFTRRIYPELDPRPERAIVERMRAAIFGHGEVDPRTAILISLTHHTGLLQSVFDKKKLKTQKARLEAIARGEAMAEATREVVQTMQTLILVACVTPGIVIAASG